MFGSVQTRQATTSLHSVSAQMVQPQIVSNTSNSKTHHKAQAHSYFNIWAFKLQFILFVYLSSVTSKLTPWRLEIPGESSSPCSVGALGHLENMSSSAESPICLVSHECSCQHLHDWVCTGQKNMWSCDCFHLGPVGGSSTRLWKAHAETKRQLLSLCSSAVRT